MAWPLLLIILVNCGINASKLPSYFGQPCSLSAKEDELGACAEKAANAGMKLFTSGDKELEIPNSSPLIIPNMSIKSQSNGILLNVTWKPASIYGLPDATLYNTKMSFEKKTMSFDVALPSLTLSGPHKVTGRILLLPITGSGPSKIVLTNATLHIAMNWPIHVGADGKEYVSVGDGEVKITRCDLLEIELQGLFNGHKVLGAEMNKILNQNWRLLHQELSPSVANRIFEEFRKVIEILLKNVPVTDLFAP